MIVTSTVAREHALDLESVLCLEGKVPLGRVIHIFHYYIIIEYFNNLF